MCQQFSQLSDILLVVRHHGAVATDTGGPAVTVWWGVGHGGPREKSCASLLRGGRQGDGDCHPVWWEGGGGRRREKEGGGREGFVKEAGGC